jgi:hypothetical protein
MSYILPLTAEEVKKRLLKVADLAVHPATQVGSDIKVVLDHFIEEGSEIKFKAPSDNSAATKLLVQYIDNDGKTLTKTFAFADANGNDVGEINNLFAKDAIVKVILDLDSDIDGQGTAAAFVQNADTNAYLENRFSSLPVASGSGENSIIFGDAADAQGVYSVAGGTNDKELIKEILGGSGILGDLVVSMEDIEVPTAEADMSMSFGAGTKATAIGSMSIGLNTTTGCKGYYWQNFVINNDGTATIQLSTTQPKLKTNYSVSGLTATLTYYLSEPTPPTSLAWEIGDEISIRNTQEYDFCSKITAIDATNGTITVDYLPFTENTYVPEPFTGGLTAILEIIKNLTNTFYPFDLTIKVPSKPTSGVVDCSWVSFAHGYNNNSTGLVSSVFGMNNIADGQASFVTGGGNKGGHMALVGGRYNVANGDASFAVGYKNTAFGTFSKATGSNTSAFGPYSSSEGYGTIAYGAGACAEGRGTIALDDFQHVQGRWNKKSTSGAWVVGNGTSDENRSNAAQLDWDGNLRLAGDVQGYHNGETVGLGNTWNALKQVRERVESLEEYFDRSLESIYASTEYTLQYAINDLMRDMPNGSDKFFEVTPHLFEEDFSSFADENTNITSVATSVGDSVNWNGATPSPEWTAIIMSGSVSLKPEINSHNNNNVSMKMTPYAPNGVQGRMQLCYTMPADLYEKMSEDKTYRVSVSYTTTYNVPDYLGPTEGRVADFDAQLETKSRAANWDVVRFETSAEGQYMCEHEFTIDKSFGKLQLTFGIAWPGGSIGELSIDNIALTEVNDQNLFESKRAIGHLYRINEDNMVVSFTTCSESGNKRYEMTRYNGRWSALKNIDSSGVSGVQIITWGADD